MFYCILSFPFFLCMFYIFYPDIYCLHSSIKYTVLKIEQYGSYSHTRYEKSQSPPAIPAKPLVSRLTKLSGSTA